MKQLGIGAILHSLRGYGEDELQETDYYDKEIVDAEIIDERLRLTFTDKTYIEIFDAGQSCCEYRHMTTDDDVKSLVGHKLRNVEAKPGPEVEQDYDCHEQMFVEVTTDVGFITLVNHNEHNGWYGGFGLTVTEGTV